MKDTLLYILMCLGAINLNGQVRDIEVLYEYRHPAQSMKSAEPDVINQYVLVADGKRSKFYSPKTEYIDSIESTPEGFDNFNTFKRICYENKKSDLIPRVDGSFYIVKSGSEKKIRTYDIASATRFRWEEKMTDIEWNVADSTKNILGYECFFAVADFHGRQWNVWFTPEIPVKDGPWKLHGLPGLILEAGSEGGQYSFIAKGIQQVSNPFYNIYSEGNWEPIAGKEFWRLRRSCLDNPSRNINSGAKAVIFKGVMYGKYLPKEIVDYIETDY